MAHRNEQRRVPAATRSMPTPPATPVSARAWPLATAGDDMVPGASSAWAVLHLSALPYTSNPFRLLWSDTLLFFANAKYLLNIVRPLTPWLSGSLDELYPDGANLWALAVHGVLIVLQLLFLLSAVPLLLFPVWPLGSVVAYAGGFLVGNKFVCDLLLNYGPAVVHSDPALTRGFAPRPKECWIYINGVAAGQHWAQNNIDRLARSFGRPVVGVHNPTTGILFDVIQCLIQRDFGYATQDIRNGYAVVKDALLSDQHDKVVLVLHSQGGIEGGAILDWLYADMPGHLLGKLEVYTFGNAANHFNNPRRETGSGEDSHPHVIRHVEHYANQYDFVARWGVLAFASLKARRTRQNRFEGRLFVQEAAGHQLNQHYLDTMFPLEDTVKGQAGKPKGLREHNPFMDARAVFADDEAQEDSDSTSSAAGADGTVGSAASPSRAAHTVLVRRPTWSDSAEAGSNLSASASLASPAPPALAGPPPMSNGCSPALRVRDLSRLWQYRNGGVPSEQAGTSEAA